MWRARAAQYRAPTGHLVRVERIWLVLNVKRIEVMRSVMTRRCPPSTSCFPKRQNREVRDTRGLLAVVGGRWGYMCDGRDQ